MGLPPEQSLDRSRVILKSPPGDYDVILFIAFVTVNKIRKFAKKRCLFQRSVRCVYID